MQKQGARRMIPEARQNGLIVKELDDELIIYDQRSKRAHNLNAEAAFVWHHCDGLTSVEEMAERLEGGRDFETNLQVVRLALEDLEKAGLVKETGVPMARRHVSRRQAMVAIAAAGLALPLVKSIMVP